MKGAAAELESLVDAYVAALPIVAISIAPECGGRAGRLGVGLVPGIIDALWFEKPQHAELVVMTCVDDFRSLGAVTEAGFIDLHARSVRDFVVNTAAILGASWRTNLEVRHDASFEVQKIITTVEISRRTGGLQEVNAAYKVLRLSGETKLSYAAHLAAFTRSLVMRAAQNVAIAR